MKNKSSKHTNWLFILIIILSVVISYNNIFNNDFVCDDVTFIGWDPIDEYKKALEINPGYNSAQSALKKLLETD